MNCVTQNVCFTQNKQKTHISKIKESWDHPDAEIDYCNQRFANESRGNYSKNR